MPMKNIGMFNRSEKNPNVLNVRAIILPTLLYLACGILLMTLKSLALRITSWGLAAFLVGYGGLCLYRYFKADPLSRLTESNMARGLLLIVCGGLLMTAPDFLKDILPSVWGLAMFFGAFLKVQYAFDERALKVKNWWLMLIFAAVSLVIGILSLLRPGFFGDNVETIIGIFLIAESILDAVVFFLLNRAIKENMALFTPPAGAVPTEGNASATDGSAAPATNPAALPETPASDAAAGNAAPNPGNSAPAAAPTQTATSAPAQAAAPTQAADSAPVQDPAPTQGA